MIDIIAGALGSGKSELSLNMALAAAAEHPVLADADIVNPFFCSRERQEELKAAGVTYIGPSLRMSLADVPYISPEISGYIRSNRRLIIDVGGDESGGAVLGYLSREILARPYHMYLVVNPFRPFTETEKQTAELRAALEKTSRLRFAAVISNPNLAAATCAEDVVAGHGIVTGMAASMGLPLHCLAVEKRLYDAVNARIEIAVARGLLEEVQLCPVDMQLRPDWLEEAGPASK